MPTLLGLQRKGQATLRSRRGVPVFEESYYYLVQADDPGQQRLEILRTPGLPLPGRDTSAGGLAVCTSNSANQREDNLLLWDVQSDYSSEVEEGQDSQDPDTDPQAWIPVYETKFERIQEPASKDRLDAPIANSAGAPFEVGVMLSRFIPIWEFYQIEAATVTDEQLLERNEVTNSGVFKGRPAKSLLCTVLSSSLGFFYGQRRRLTQYQLKYNSKLWTHKRLDTGTYYKVGGAYEPYYDNTTEKNIVLGALDGSGGKATVGDGPAILEFDIYEPSDFSFLRA
jgi:hypothetical protein